MLTLCFIPSKIYIASTQCTVRTNLQCACALKKKIKNHVLNIIYLIYDSDWSLVTGIFFRWKCFVFLQPYLLTRNLLCFKHIFDCFKYARLCSFWNRKKVLIFQTNFFLKTKNNFPLERNEALNEEYRRAVLGTD